MNISANSSARGVLSFVGSVEIPAQPELVIRDKFVVNTRRSANLKISHVGPHLDFWFGDKVEPSSPKLTLDINELDADEAFSEEIFSALSWNGSYPIPISAIYYLMILQGGGEKGFLSLDEGNLFEVLDRNNDPWWWVLCWDIDGWDVDGQLIDRKYPWRKPERIFSKRITR